MLLKDGNRNVLRTHWIRLVVFVWPDGANILDERSGPPAHDSSVVDINRRAERGERGQARGERKTGREKGEKTRMRENTQEQMGAVAGGCGASELICSNGWFLGADIRELILLRGHQKFNTAGAWVCGNLGFILEARSEDLQCELRLSQNPDTGLQ